MKEITAMRKKINNYICFMVLFLCSLPAFGYEIPSYDVAYDKDVIVPLPYLKPKGVAAIPIHSRLSVKIDKLVINGKKRIRGKRIWWWMGADETYALLNHQVADTKEGIENLDMSWDVEKADEGYKLVYSSLIHSVPTIYEIPSTAEEVFMTYRIKFPDGSFSTENTICFKLSWPESL